MDGLRFLIRVFTVALFFVFTLKPVHAHHLRAGDITVQLISCHSNIYLITVTGYTDNKVSLEFGYEVLDFGDGTFINLDTCESVKKDLGNDVTVKTIQFEHAFPGPGIYTIRYHEPNRNDYVLNMFNSGFVAFYVETQIVIDPFLFCNNTPVLLNPPIDRGAIGVKYLHNPAAWDPDGDSLGYKLVPCKQNIDRDVPGFMWPNEYDIEKVNATNEAGTGLATFTIDKYTGDICWDAPAIKGQYNVAFIVEEWRKIEGQWYKLGYITRDMQILIEDSDNNPPELFLPSDTCVTAGATIDEIIKATDPDGHDIIIEAYSGIYNAFGSAITLTPYPFSYQPSPASLHLEWHTGCNHVREKPYQLMFKAKDNPVKLNEQPPLVDIDSWYVTIVAPAPEGLMATLLPDNRIRLNWDTYSCKNASNMQIWRRVGSYDFDYGNCEVGIPDYAGYSLIDEVDSKDTVYIDGNSGLAYGASYCYRLVAVFPKPRGGKVIHLRRYV